MNFFRRLFNRTSTHIEQSAETEALQNILIQFISASTWKTSQSIIEVHPELLDSSTDALISQLLSVEEDEAYRQNLETHRILLQRCRKVGIEQAFDEKIKSGSHTRSQKVEDILQELSQPTQYRMVPHRIELCYQLLGSVDKAIQTRLWAGLKLELGNYLCLSSADSREENIESAIAIYREVLDVLTPEGMPIEWAKAMNNLGNAYTDRIWGNRQENIEEAIRAYLGTLSVMQRETRPYEWAQTMNNLAFAYAIRQTGERMKNIEDAISACQDALSVITQDMPVEWARAMNNLATAYRQRVKGNQSENIEYAFDICQEVLKKIDVRERPLEWAQTTKNLGMIYEERILGNRKENLQAAIHAYEEVYTLSQREMLPLALDEIKMNLDRLYAVPL